MLRRQHPGAAVNPLEPGHQLQIFPHRAQQDLIEMGMRIDQTRHEHGAGGIQRRFAGHRLGRRTGFDLGDHSVAHAHVAVEEFARFRHRHDERVGNDQIAHVSSSPIETATSCRRSLFDSLPRYAKSQAAGLVGN